MVFIMFYLAGSNTSICSIALALLLVVVFWFLILISTIHDLKDIVQLSTKDNEHFYDMVKIQVMIIYKMLIFLR